MPFISGRRYWAIPSNELVSQAHQDLDRGWRCSRWQSSSRLLAVMSIRSTRRPRLRAGHLADMGGGRIYRHGCRSRGQGRCTSQPATPTRSLTTAARFAPSWPLTASALVRFAADPASAGSRSGLHLPRHRCQDFAHLDVHPMRRSSRAPHLLPDLDRLNAPSPGRRAE